MKVSIVQIVPAPVGDWMVSRGDIKDDDGVCTSQSVSVSPLAALALLRITEDEEQVDRDDIMPIADWMIGDGFGECVEEFAEGMTRNSVQRGEVDPAEVIYRLCAGDIRCQIREYSDSAIITHTDECCTAQRAERAERVAAGIRRVARQP